MWRCETCGKLNSTGADRCHGCDRLATAPEKGSLDSQDNLDDSISAWSDSGTLSDGDLDDPGKLKAVFKALPSDMQPPVIGPGCLKIETTTFIEGLSMLMIVLSIAFLIFTFSSCGHIGYGDYGRTVFSGFVDSWVSFLLCAVVGIAVLIFSIIMTVRYNVYYIIDLKRNLILLHREVFGWKIVRPAGDLNQVEFVAAGATNIHNISKGSSAKYKCYYAVFILLADGLKLDLPGYTENYTTAVKAARVFAGLLDTQCIEGAPVKFVRFRKQSRYGSVVAEYLDPSMYQPSKLKDPFYWCCGLGMFFIFAYLFYVIYYQVV